jgi:ubiquinone/menaquinone biosynthesis C-methylase UbiE
MAGITMGFSVLACRLKTNLSDLPINNMMMEISITKVFDNETALAQWDSDYYHPIALRLYDKLISDMLRLMEVPAQATVLDAGCGPGVHSVQVARAGHRVHAIDISSTMLRHARRRVKEARVEDRVEFSRQDLTRLDLPTASVRHAFSWGVIIHIPEAERALDELARVMQPGGRLALYLTNRFALDKTIERWARFLTRMPLSGMESRALGDCVCYSMRNDRLWVWWFDIDRVVTRLEEKGFKLKHKRFGELSQIQARLSGIPRRLLLHANNLAYRLQFLRPIACSSLLILEKEGAPS